LSRNDESGEAGDNIFNLTTNAAIARNGRYILIGIPLQNRRNHPQQASPDRIGNSQENIQMIVALLNIYLKPSNEEFQKVRPRFFRRYRYLNCINNITKRPF